MPVDELHPAKPALPSPRRRKLRYEWLFAGAGTVVLGAAVLAIFVPSDKELAAHAETELTAALGVKTTVGALNWRLFPTLAITLQNVATDQSTPVTIKALTLYPHTALLWQKRIRLKELRIEGAVVPQLSLSGLGPKTAPSEQRFTLDSLPLAKLVLSELSWVSRYGVAVTLAGQVDFDAGWRPRQARLYLPEAKTATAVELQRQHAEDSWSVVSTVGGGTLNGSIQLETAQNGPLRLRGKLQPQGIEVSSFLEAFNRRPIIAGKASGQTSLAASGDSMAVLVRSLRTQTSFVMGPSTLLRFDLDKAIRTLGKEHAGRTPLDSLTGQLVTQNSASSGMMLSFTNLKAASGVLTASGNARLQNRRIQAEVAVDLVNGVVGIPLTITGPVASVSVSMPAGAVAGEVAGTAVLPGVGTAIGARIGAAVGNIFGRPPQKPSAPPPQARPQRP